ncbi:hypothetical protein JOD20_004813, partial [Herpetosiphon giganteus]|nr:hypothetical protein [Herpetosiphon giganteus]
VLLWVWFRHHPVYQTEVVLYPLVERPCPPLNAWRRDGRVVINNAE